MNMIEKSVGGIKITMSYDTANRLLAATTASATRDTRQETRFEYDPAGRLTAQTVGGETTSYQYGLFEKTSAVIKSDGSRVGFDYWPNGQIAAKGELPSLASVKSVVKSDAESDLFGIKAALAEKRATENNALTVASAGNKFKETEAMLWDGLALLQRGEESFTVEPHISGGVPLTACSVNREACSAPQVLISDFLGTTLGTVQGEAFTPAPMTAFGENVNREAYNVKPFFTGKMWDADLQSYNFLYRNYHPQMARWTAVDPSGFPDGVNQWAYCRNQLNKVDAFGLAAGDVLPGIPMYNTAVFAVSPSISKMDPITTGGNGNYAITGVNVTWSATVNLTFKSPFQYTQGSSTATVGIPIKHADSADFGSEIILGLALIPGPWLDVPSFGIGDLIALAIGQSLPEGAPIPGNNWGVIEASILLTKPSSAKDLVFGKIPNGSWPSFTAAE